MKHRWECRKRGCFLRSGLGLKGRHVCSFRFLICNVKNKINSSLKIGLRSLKEVGRCCRAGPLMESAFRILTLQMTVIYLMKVSLTMVMGSNVLLSTPKMRCCRNNYHLKKTLTQTLFIRLRLLQILGSLNRQSSAWRKKRRRSI